MARFNEDQRKAVEAANQTLLISAAAGSGKTTVMVSRIARELTEGNRNIEKFLVITFTRDAADHMRRKLEDTLNEMAANPRTGERQRERVRLALQGIDCAAISTIHAFCMNTIREHFDAAGISADTHALEEDVTDQLFDDAYDAAVESCFGRESSLNSEEADHLKTLFGALKQDEIREAVRQLHGVVMGLPFPFETLAKMTDGAAARWAEEIRDAVSLDLAEIREIRGNVERYLTDPLTPPLCIPALEMDLMLTERFMDEYPKQRTDEDRIRLLRAASEQFEGITVRKCPEESKNLYEEIKATRKRLRGSDSLFIQAADALEALTVRDSEEDRIRAERETKGLILLLKKTDEAYRKAKKALGGVDFSDMEQLTFQLLQHETIREEMLQKYTDVYVDETQDISAIQNAILEVFQTEGHRLFMVGDIKQSIYRFRHAEPEIFDRRRRSYDDSESAQCRRIFFRDNYRSCRAVIACVNQVFQKCMRREITELDYAPEDHLRPNREGEWGPVEIHLAEKAGIPEDQDSLSVQCHAAGEIIRRLIQDGYRYRDIAILLRSARTDAPKMTEYFKKMHIPVLYNGPQSFFGLTEIAHFMDLLQTIVNERSDVELYGTLKNMPFLFTDTELADIRLEHRDGFFWEAWQFCSDRNEKNIDRRCRAARDQLRTWRQRVRVTPAPEFIWNLMRETGFYALRGAFPEGRLRQANLDALYQKALKMYERGVLWLDDFLQEIRKIQIADKKGNDSAQILSDEDDLVRIMTMHGSKGLEFPAVILMNLHKNMMNRESRSPIRMDLSGERPLGVYLPSVNRAKHIKRHTYGKRAFDIRARRNAIAEETRLLYVAMTRAEKRLFLTGVFSRKDIPIWKNRTDESRIWKTRSMLDMIMPAALDEADVPEAPGSNGEGDWRIVLTEAGNTDDENFGVPEEFEQALRAAVQGPVQKPECLWIPEERTEMPVKTSVTAMVHAAAEKEEEETAQTKRRTERALTTFRLSDTPEKPAFMQDEEPDSTEIGTVTHRFFRLIPLEVFRKEKDYAAALQSILNALTASGRIEPEEAEMIRIDQAAVFLETELGQRLIRADHVKREWPFTMRIREDQETLIQGVIDAAFLEEGAWVLIDYKTDWDTERESFVARHERQMNWYRTAVERLSGIPVKEMWLVALRRGTAYPVERKEV